MNFDMASFQNKRPFIIKNCFSEAVSSVMLAVKTKKETFRSLLLVHLNQKFLNQDHDHYHIFWTINLDILNRKHYYLLCLMHKFCFPDIFLVHGAPEPVQRFYFDFGKR